MPARPALIEFPADDPQRARRFWSGLLDADLGDRAAEQGEGWQTAESSPAVGVHPRGRGPGDTVSLPYFAVADVAQALARVQVIRGRRSSTLKPCSSNRASSAGATVGKNSRRGMRSAFRNASTSRSMSAADGSASSSGIA